MKKNNLMLLVTDLSILAMIFVCGYLCKHQRQQEQQVEKFSTYDDIEQGLITALRAKYDEKAACQNLIDSCFRQPRTPHNDSIHRGAVLHLLELNAECKEMESRYKYQKELLDSLRNRAISNTK